MNRSECRKAFIEQYGGIGEIYDADTWMERFGVYWSAWQERQKEVEQLTAELKDRQSAFEDACRTVARMHAAAVGGIRAPRLGVVEDVQDLAQQCRDLQEAVKEYRQLVDDLMSERRERREDEDRLIEALVEWYLCYREWGSPFVETSNRVYRAIRTIVEGDSHA